MKSEDRIFYVYKWIREDYNTPFYIGKGKGNRYLRVDNRKPHNVYGTIKDEKRNEIQLHWYYKKEDMPTTTEREDIHINE